MKKLILITGVFLSTSLWSDMDYTCDIYATDTMSQFNRDGIKEYCERNNIFRVLGLDENGLNETIAQYCRFDREIDFFRSQKEDFTRQEFYYLTCVLYDNEPRKGAIGRN